MLSAGSAKLSQAHHGDDIDKFMNTSEVEKTIAGIDAKYKLQAHGISDKVQIEELQKKCSREKYSVMKGLNKKNERASPRMILKAKNSLCIEEETKKWNNLKLGFGRYRLEEVGESK